MASIKIQAGQKNLAFAALVADEAGAEFAEEGQWITITDTPSLTIPRYCFDQAFDPEGQRAQQGDTRLESAWRSLLLNKQGYLRSFNDSEIYITDDKPQEKRPSFLLRFPNDEMKERTEEWAERAGFSSLTDFILNAIARACEFWEGQACEGQSTR